MISCAPEALNSNKSELVCIITTSVQIWPAAPFEITSRDLIQQRSSKVKAELVVGCFSREVQTCSAGISMTANKTSILTFSLLVLFSLAGVLIPRYQSTALALVTNAVIGKNIKFDLSLTSLTCHSCVVFSLQALPSHPGHVLCVRAATVQRLGLVRHHHHRNHVSVSRRDQEGLLQTPAANQHPEESGSWLPVVHLSTVCFDGLLLLNSGLIFLHKMLLIV